MANIKFSRDEAILTLDVLYSSNRSYLSPHSKEINELSKQLNSLPIYPKEKRPPNFRNCVGVSNQIQHFLNRDSSGAKGWNVGGIFFQVDSEYSERHEELHNVAEAIRRNSAYFLDYPFGDALEDLGFQEGILLGHIHRLIEARDSKKIPLSERCEICQIIPELIYKNCGTLLRHHLTVKPEELDWKKSYSNRDFITVCPNCHAALHRYRPWIDKTNFGELLR